MNLFGACTERGKDVTPKLQNAEDFKCLDLFCGAGGLSLGFEMSGGEVLGGLDFDRDSILSYKSNFPRAKYTENVSLQDWVPPQELVNEVEVLIGGPPCQGFSLARGRRFVDDPRNSLYKEFIRVLNTIHPRWFVMENVQGILNIGGGIIREQIFEDFHNAGYKVDVRVIDMAQYGVPQRRKRAIFVGNCNGVDFEWPTPTHARRERVYSETMSTLEFPGVAHRECEVAVNDALSDLHLPQGNFFSHRANSQMRGPRNRDAHADPAFTLRVRGDEFALCELPAESSFIPGDRPAEPTFVREPKNDFQRIMQTYVPRWKEEHVATMTSKESPIRKLKGTRKLTMREQARLQSFPDAFTFIGSPVSKSRQIGNAVPPIFGQVLFSAIHSQIKD